MRKQFNKALKRGLPSPILKIFDYLSFEDGNVWSRHYRQAGCYATAVLWLAFLCWSVQALVLIWLPSYFTRAVGVVGAIICFADMLILILTVLTQESLKIAYLTSAENRRVDLLEVQLGWCFYATFCTGILCVFIGVLFGILEGKSLYKLSTFWQLGVDDEHDLYDDDEQMRELKEDKAIEFLPHPMMSRQISLHRKRTVLALASRIFPQWFAAKEKCYGRKVGVVEIGFNPGDFIYHDS